MSLDNEIKAAMVAAVDHLKKELKSLRTSRANPAMLDGVFVEVYGTNMRLKDIANVTTPEPRQLLITPFDPSNAPAIGKGIEAANLNINPIVEGHLVRINVPPMDESVRKEIVKQCKKKLEDAKIAMREVRRKYNDLVRKQKNDGDLTEDQMKRFEKIIQEMTDKFCKECDVAAAEKEKEIMVI